MRHDIIKCWSLIWRCPKKHRRILHDLLDDRSFEKSSDVFVDGRDDVEFHPFDGYISSEEIQ
jgi:hypothetical protein